MNKEQVRALVGNINIWKRGSVRAPHKPLLLLYALGKCSRGEPRQIPFSEIDRDLKELLDEFGPPRKSYHPEYPFWRLQNDGLWELSGTARLETRKGHDDAKRSELLRHNVKGGFPESIYSIFCQDPEFLTEITKYILDRNFPSSVHDDLISALGLKFHISAPRNLRYASIDREKYLTLTKDELSPFEGAFFKDVFLYSACYAFRSGLARKEVEQPEPNLPLSAFSDEEIWLLKAIAIAETGSLNILTEGRKLYTIAEEYANSALESVYLEVFGGKPGEPYKRMTQDVWDEFQHLELE